MHNYSTYYANYTDPDKLFYGSITNALRGSLGILAIFFNFLVICIFGTHKHLRTSKINWAVSNLMFSNILMCSMLVIYSFIKLTDRRAPYSTEMCLVLNWFMVSASFGPTWSIVLMTSLRALFYSKRSKKWDEILTLERLIILRLFLAFLDVLFATVVIFDVTDLTKKTHCAYQIMLEKSSF
uniref:G-protein coupled receptors family 1 profile domain-containing protein n=1 Tax=Romanomermis culicivorax TaxID=13658 RepID=A0A915IQ93_ROMCU